MPERISAQIDYDTVLAELYARRDDIDASIATMLLLKGSGSAVTSNGAVLGGSVRVTPGAGIPSNAFFSMSLVDAAKKCIELKQARLTLQEIVNGLAEGGMPGQKPNTVYAALRRRESQNGDINRLDDRWGLKEWGGGTSNKKATKAKRSKKKGAKKAAKAASAKSAKSEKAAEPKSEETKARDNAADITVRDAAYAVLDKENAPLHAGILAERINKGYGKTTNLKALAASLKDDGQQRFDNIGHNTWVLNGWPDEKKKPRPVAVAATA